MLVVLSRRLCAAGHRLRHLSLDEPELDAHLSEFRQQPPQQPEHCQRAHPRPVPRKEVHRRTPHPAAPVCNATVVQVRSGRFGALVSGCVGCRWLCCSHVGSDLSRQRQTPLSPRSRPTPPTRGMPPVGPSSARDRLVLRQPSRRANTEARSVVAWSSADVSPRRLRRSHSWRHLPSGWGVERGRSIRRSLRISYRVSGRGAQAAAPARRCA